MGTFMPDEPGESEALLERAAGGEKAALAGSAAGKTFRVWSAILRKRLSVPRWIRSERKDNTLLIEGGAE
jgi:hypothetical protein